MFFCARGGLSHFLPWPALGLANNGSGCTVRIYVFVHKEIWLSACLVLKGEIFMRIFLAAKGLDADDNAILSWIASLRVRREWNLVLYIGYGKYMETTQNISSEAILWTVVRPISKQIDYFGSAKFGFNPEFRSSIVRGKKDNINLPNSYFGLDGLALRFFRHF